MAKILLVEDDRSDLIATTRLLRACDHEVVMAGNGNVASQRFSEAKDSDRPFDLILTDWRYPDGGGDKLIRAVRQQHNSQIPIIIVSGDLEGVVERVTARDDVFQKIPILHKPILSSILLCEIASLTGTPPAASAKDALKPGQ